MARAVKTPPPTPSRKGRGKGSLILPSGKGKRGFPPPSGRGLGGGLRSRAKKIAALLRRTYPATKTALSHADPFQLLIATILSAQCTDVQVNKVTPALFAKYATPQALSRARQSDVTLLIHSTGFFQNKARNIIACAGGIVERFGGDVPNTLEDLITLPGVGRKTANVVRAAWWDIPGMVVDTHVKRLSNLLGLTTESDPTKIEFALMALLPAEAWNAFSMNLILHGRKICIARRPKCPECVLNQLCPSAR